MDLTNIEGIERLECITVFTEVASKLSGESFYDSTQKRIGTVTGKRAKMSKVYALGANFFK